MSTNILNEVESGGRLKECQVNPWRPKYVNIPWAFLPTGLKEVDTFRIYFAAYNENPHGKLLNIQFPDLKFIKGLVQD